MYRTIKFSPSYIIYLNVTVYLIVTLLFIQPVFAAEDTNLDQLKSMSLENLMDITVFSASKKSEQLAGVSAAMYVINREDIRRSGARTLPDLLRGVPGLTVANIDAHSWAITSRGFNGLYANKLLVMIDGRTLYTPLYSGVYWDMQDTLLEDIERIEIIRGPGATIWGANAVNGVINIMTRHAEDTDGAFVSAGGGSLDKSSFNGRFGKAGDKLSYRIYAKRLDLDRFKLSGTDDDHPDDWVSEKTGFRADWAANSADQFTFQGDLYQGKSNQLMTYGSGTDFQSDVDYSGGSFQLQWKRELDADSAWEVQAYMDRSLREDDFLDQSRTTWDVSFNHHFNLLHNHVINWGGGYRYTTDQTAGSPVNTWDPASRSDEIYNLFVQDEIALLADQLHLLIGSKFEHNDYTGYEIQPTARLIWTPDAKNSVWGAVSRAVRTPSRTDSDLTSSGIVETSTTVEVPLPPPAPPGTTIDAPAVSSITSYGNSDFKAEELIAYEIGYRSQMTENFSFDIALFYNDYKKLRTQEPGTPIVDLTTLPIQIVIPVQTGNNMSGETFGAELSANWQVSTNLRLAGTYSWLKVQLHHHGDNGDLIGEDDENVTPEHQASLRSYVDLPYNIEWDTALFYASQHYLNPNKKVAAHIRCDMRLGWSPAPAWELSLKVENIFDNQHPEYFDNLGLIASEYPRNWYAEVKYYF